MAKPMHRGSGCIYCELERRKQLGFSSSILNPKSDIPHAQQPWRWQCHCPTVDICSMVASSYTRWASTHALDCRLVRHSAEWQHFHPSSGTCIPVRNRHTFIQSPCPEGAFQSSTWGGYHKTIYIEHSDSSSEWLICLWEAIHSLREAWHLWEVHHPWGVQHLLEVWKCNTYERFAIHLREALTPARGCHVLSAVSCRRGTSLLEACNLWEICATYCTRERVNIVVSL